MIWTSVIFWQNFGKYLTSNLRNGMFCWKREILLANFPNLKFIVNEIAQISIIGIIQDKCYIISKYFHGIVVFL